MHRHHTDRAVDDVVIPGDYGRWLKTLKEKIQQARSRAALATNAELVLLYHHIGADIRTRQAAEGWGAKVIDRLSSDLSQAFPEMKGLSTRNLKYMKNFRRVVSRSAIWAAGCCPIAVVPHRGAVDQGLRPARA